MRASLWKLSAAVISLAACGSEDHAPGDLDGADAAIADAAVQADAATDPGPGPGKRCDPSKPFSMPVPARVINDPTAIDTHAALSGDERTVVFTRKVGTDSDYLCIATRASADADFGMPARLTPVTADHREYQPFLTRDARTLLYTVQLPGHRDGDIYMAAWSDAAGTFAGGAPVTHLSRPDTDEGTAFLTADGQTIYSGANTGVFDLYRSVKQPSGTFGEPSPVKELNTVDAREAIAVLSDDSREVFFASTRIPSSGGYDIWHARRPSTATDFVDIQSVPELNGDLDDRPSWLSSDGCVLYLSKGGDIYVATRGR